MFDWVPTWWPVIVVALSGLGTWAAWSSRKQFVTQDQFAKFRDSHDATHTQIDAALSKGEAEFRVIKTELANLPTRLEIEETVARAVAPLQVGIDAVKEATGGIQESVQMLLGHELAEARQAKAAASKGAP